MSVIDNPRQARKRREKLEKVRKRNLLKNTAYLKIIFSIGKKAGVQKVNVEYSQGKGKVGKKQLKYKKT